MNIIINKCDMAKKDKNLKDRILEGHFTLDKVQQKALLEYEQVLKNFGIDTSEGEEELDSAIGRQEVVSKILSEKMKTVIDSVKAQIELMKIDERLERESLKKDETDEDTGSVSGGLSEEDMRRIRESVMSTEEEEYEV